MTNQPASPLSNRIKYVLTHAREAFLRREQHTRKWDRLPNEAEIHILARS